MPETHSPHRFQSEPSTMPKIIPQFCSTPLSAFHKDDTQRKEGSPCTPTAQAQARQAKKAASSATRTRSALHPPLGGQEPATRKAAQVSEDGNPRRNQLDPSAITKLPLTTESATKKTEDKTAALTVDVNNRHQTK